MGQYLRSGILLVCTLLLLAAVSPLSRGFAPFGFLECFGPPEQKLADGTIFDYMDGGGIVYLDHGFRELVHREFSDSQTRRITFDCFTMETSVQALAALIWQQIS